jgi:hypothetical protein
MPGINHYLAIASLASATSAASLGAYHVDPSSVSVSGFSSGGFMAAQLGVAYSGTFQTGFGVFAGGPYDCARNQYVSQLLLIDSHVFQFTCTKMILTRVPSVVVTGLVHQLHVQPESLYHHTYRQYQILEREPN